MSKFNQDYTLLSCYANFQLIVIWTHIQIVVVLFMKFFKIMSCGGLWWAQVFKVPECPRDIFIQFAKIMPCVSLWWGQVSKILECSRDIFIQFAKIMPCDSLWWGQVSKVLKCQDHAMWQPMMRSSVQASRMSKRYINVIWQDHAMWQLMMRPSA